VAGDPDIGLASGQIQGRVTARAIPDTVLLEATVLDSDPPRSERIAKSLATHFVTLVETLETPIAAANSAVKVEVVAGPLLDPVPVSPRPLRNFVLAGLLGLLIGIAGAILREMLDVTIKTVETLRTVAGAPVLAVVPFDADAKKSPLVMSDSPQSARAEAFRHLRTNLQFVDVDQPVKAIVVTSSLPDEGKSTTAVNLAIAFAEMGHRVVLIEADMRRPRVADYLGVEGAVGLSNVLAGQVSVDDVLQPWGQYDLHVLPSGFVPPNPSELLGSRNMAALLVHLRTEFDVILIDTPPLLPVTDAAVVATHADGAVLVTRSGKTAQARVRAALASLRAVDSRVLGCVLNRQRITGEDYYYSTYYRDEPTGPTSPRQRQGGKGQAGKTRAGKTRAGKTVVAAPRTPPPNAPRAATSPDPAGGVTALFDGQPRRDIETPGEDGRHSRLRARR
ncbi:MAG: tyrosine-protein kinase, partial [Micromonosporaceae bacterium]|nr:tyrosine-protein kinase [Micromonosporaceae bacterium]